MAVYITDALYNYGDSDFNDGYVAQKRAQTYIQGAFDRTGHSVNFLDPDSTPNAPTEYYDKSFTTACPCDPRYNCSYDRLLGWFRDWIECDDKPRAADANLLLSKVDNVNGGVAFGDNIYAHAQTGKYVAQLSDIYEKYGYKKSHDGMDTAYHEMGHLFMGITGDEDNDGVGHHDVAAVYDHGTQDDTMSAMGVNGDTNDCGDQVDTSNVGGEEMVWSDCCISNWK